MDFVNVDTTHISLDDVVYPKMFYAKVGVNGKIEVRNKYTEKLFIDVLYSNITIATTGYNDVTTTVSELNKIF